MAKIIDITDKLVDEKPIIRIKGTDYEVNNEFLVSLQIQQLAQSGDLEDMKKAIELAIPSIDFEKEKFTINGLNVLFTAITAALRGVDYSTIEEQFRKLTSI